MLWVRLTEKATVVVGVSVYKTENTKYVLKVEDIISIQVFKRILVFVYHINTLIILWHDTMIQTIFRMSNDAVIFSKPMPPPCISNRFSLKLTKELRCVVHSVFLISHNL